LFPLIGLSFLKDAVASKYVFIHLLEKAEKKLEGVLNVEIS